VHPCNWAFRYDTWPVGIGGVVSLVGDRGVDPSVVCVCVYGGGGCVHQCINRCIVVSFV
jgi:hypothetical protein